VDVYFSFGVFDVRQDFVGAENMEAFQQAIAERVAEQHRHHGKSQFFWVWAALLIMTAIEVYLTYQNMQPVRMLTIFDGLVARKGGAYHWLLHAHEV
jgi:hypothetical protein